MTQGIGDWLERLGLGRYVDAFTDADVDARALLHLNQDDLRELGVSLGHRKVMLAAIADMPAAEADPPSPGAEKHEAERRQLTLMFVDLVGSTALAERLDPEEMRDVITGYQNTVAGVVTRFAGHVAKYMGDGVLCYFGWPHAHEDDAERAVLAGLAVTQAMAAMKTPGGEALTARAGIATGLVVVGDLIGAGAAQEEAVVGGAPNLAARVQGLAAPGRVVVAETTHHLLGDVFELDDLGAHTLKGIAGETQVFAVVGERSAESRFEARLSGSVTAMVGRDHELALMMERWGHAKQREGQLLLLTGEAGIGKSRITRALVDAVAGEPHFRVSYQCSPYHTDTSLYPVVQQLTFAAKIAPGDSNDEKLDKLEAVLEDGGAALLAALMGLDGSARYGPVDLTPEIQRARTLQALTDQLIALSRRRPVLFVLEDAHWIDATTLEMLDLCLDQVAAARVMMLVTGRPAFEHSFGGHPIMTRLALNRLGREQITAIVAKLTRGKALPAELMDEIAAKTDGVPLFVEELTKAVLESGELTETAMAFELSGPLAHLSIPATLHDSLMARLDRLQPVKEVAQMAACIGREFSYQLLADISPLDDAELGEALERLIAAELVFGRGTPPEARYVYKHALVRDAAYESLLKTRRQAIHAKLVDALEAQADAAPEILAHHATEAGLTEKAIGWWSRAGEIAMARPAYQEAITHIRAAIRLIGEMEDTQEWREKELAAQVELAQALMFSEGHGSVGPSRAFERAAELLQATGNRDLRMPVHYGRWIGHYMRAEHETGLALATEQVAEFDGEDDDEQRLSAHRMRAATLIALGRPAEALEHLEIALSLYRPGMKSNFARRFAQELGVQVRVYLAFCHWMLGHADQSRAMIDVAEATVGWLLHANTSCYAAMHWAMIGLAGRDEALLRKHNGRVVEIAAQHGMKLWESYGGINAAILDSRDGDTGALARLQCVIDEYTGRGNRLFIPFYMSGQAEELLRLGRTAEAQEVVRRALEVVKATGENWAEPELLRIEGELHLAGSRTEQASAAFQQAIDTAHARGLKFYELRASTSLGRLCLDQGDLARGRELLRSVLDSFTEEFSAPDLVDARALLDQMG